MAANAASIGLYEPPSIALYHSGALPFLPLGDTADVVSNDADVPHSFSGDIRYIDNDSDNDEDHVRPSEIKHDKEISPPQSKEFDAVMQELVQKTQPHDVDIDIITPAERPPSPISPTDLLVGNILKLGNGKIAYKVSPTFRPNGRAQWANFVKRRNLRPWNEDEISVDRDEKDIAPQRRQLLEVEEDSLYTSCDDWSDRHNPRCRGRRRRPHRFLPFMRRSKVEKNPDSFQRRWESHSVDELNDRLSDQIRNGRRQSLGVVEETAMAKRATHLIVSHEPTAFTKHGDTRTYTDDLDDDYRSSNTWSDEWGMRSSCDHLSDLDKPGCTIEELKKKAQAAQEADFFRATFSQAQGNATGKDSSASLASKKEPNDATIVDAANGQNASTVAQQPSAPLSVALLKRANTAPRDDNTERSSFKEAQQAFLRRWAAGDEHPRPFEPLQVRSMGLDKRDARGPTAKIRRLNRRALMMRAVGMNPSGPSKIAVGDDQLPAGSRTRLRQKPRVRQSGERHGLRNRPGKGAVSSRRERNKTPRIGLLVKRQEEKEVPDKARMRSGLAFGRNDVLAKGGSNAHMHDRWPPSPSTANSFDASHVNGASHRHRTRIERRPYRKRDLEREGVEAQVNVHESVDDHMGRRSQKSHPDLAVVCPGGICLRDDHPMQSLQRRDGGRMDDHGERERERERDHEEKDDLDRRSHSSHSGCHHCHRHHYWRRWLKPWASKRERAEHYDDAATIRSGFSHHGDQIDWEGAEHRQKRDSE